MTFLQGYWLSGAQAPHCPRATGNWPLPRRGRQGNLYPGLDTGLLLLKAWRAETGPCAQGLSFPPVTSSDP